MTALQETSVALRVIIPVVRVGRSGDDTSITIRTALISGIQCVPVFSTEELYRQFRPPQTEGLFVPLDDLPALLEPEDGVVLDPGTEHMSIWKAPQFAAFLLVVADLLTRT